jgi:nucleotide-binding universal stress UspA family protein
MASAVRAAELVQLGNILYATDFSEPSELALPFVEGLARRYGATVHALHVLTLNGLASFTPEMAGIAYEAAAERALASMQELDSRLAGLHHQTLVERALNVWQGVEQVIRDRSIDLIVVGTHGRTGATRLVLGSVAEEIFRRSALPVMTVGPAVRTSTHNGGHFHRILFATDYTPASVCAAPFAVSLAEVNQGRLVLVHVAPTFNSKKADRKSDLSVAEMIQRLYDTVPQDARLSIPPEVAIEYGHPSEKIIDAAKRRSADLIVLGVRSAHGHLGAATHLERATAHEVVAHAPCPVLTVRESP